MSRRGLASRTALLALLLSSTVLSQVIDLRGNPADPLSDHSQIHVLLFLRTDCPITNRYAPELRRITNRFSGSEVGFFLVYSGKAESRAIVEEHIREYQLPEAALLDPQHELVAKAHATVAPEAAVFDRTGNLLYVGRIDDRWISFGRSRSQPDTHDLEQAISAALAGKKPAEQRTQAIGCSLEDAR